MIRFLGWLGRRTLTGLAHIGGATQLTFDTTYWTVVAPFQGKGLRWREAFRQMVLIGVRAIPIIFLIHILVGVIMAIQGAYQLRRFGATLLVADLVAIAHTREIGPLITAIILAGRSGASIAAEISTMKIYEEVDALESMGFNPVKFLVVPKLLALVLMGFCLTVIADFVGILGGFLVGTQILHIGPALYITETAQALQLKDINTGLVKSVAFALIIGMTACYLGFRARGGAEEVGQATTRTVVGSIFFVIVADWIFTALFYYTT